MSCPSRRGLATKKDKRASDDVTQANFAASGVASVHKKLMADCQELVAIQKFIANGRNQHYSMTMPWSDMGLRLLPTAQYFKYHQAMTEMQDEFHRLVNTFLQGYEWEITQASAKLGDLFDRDEYPLLDSFAPSSAFASRTSLCLMLVTSALTLAMRQPSKSSRIIKTTIRHSLTTQ